MAINRNRELSQIATVEIVDDANKKVGKKVPKQPVRAIHFQESLGILLNLLHPNIDKIIVVIIIRKDPNCKGSRPTRPFLIKM